MSQLDELCKKRIVVVAVIEVKLVKRKEYNAIEVVMGIN